MNAPLVTLDRWVRNPALAKANAAQPEYAAALVAAASDTVERYCHRRFGLASYREYLSGAGWPGQTLILPQTPVVSVDRVCTRAVPVLTVTAAASAGQLARVGTTVAADGSTAGVTLALTTAGVTLSTVVTGLTLAAVASAIGATAGWAATVTPGYEQYPAAELRPLQGPVPALGRAAVLAAYVEGDAPSGEHTRLDAEAGILYGRFPAGESNLRVDYTAGYAAVPEPVQEAVVRFAQLAWQAANRNPNLYQERLGPYSATYTLDLPATMDVQVRAWLGPFVSHSNLIAVR